MKVENTPEINSNYKKFIMLLLLMFSLIVIFTIFLIVIANGQNEYFFKSLFIIIIVILFGSSLLLLGVVFSVVRLWNQYPVSNLTKKLLELSLKIVYPGMLVLGKLLKYDKNYIRRLFTELNNKLIFSNEYNIEGKNILILTPHCIQKSFCPHRITTNIENCRQCGKCNVDDLIKLKKEFGVNIRVVTGGTLARKIIKDIKPKAIIAIACERDLMSGLQDIKALPIIGILNKRPEGPCVNTLFDIEEAKIAIKHFLYKE